MAELNMTDTSQQCPGNFVERNETGISQCRIGGNQCFSVNYSTPDIDYSRICGRIAAYQVGTTNAFRRYYENIDFTTINSNYVDGVSLTHGDPRKHIWTFAAALDRSYGERENQTSDLVKRIQSLRHLWERITSVMLAKKSSLLVRLASRLTLC